MTTAGEPALSRGGKDDWKEKKGNLKARKSNKIDLGFSQ
jgi:hypothetical protein